MLLRQYYSIIPLRYKIMRFGNVESSGQFKRIAHLFREEPVELVAVEDLSLRTVGTEELHKLVRDDTHSTEMQWDVSVSAPNKHSCPP